MILKQAIIHELVKEKRVKEQPDIEPNVIQGELLNIESEAVSTLVSSILKIYGTKGNSSAQGTFNREGAYTFPDHMDGFIDNSNQNVDFEKLTSLAMACLIEAVKDKNFATGGYIVFGLYAETTPTSQAEEEFMLIAMVKKRNGITLNNLIPETIQEVDLSKLHQAVRINVSKYSLWNEQEQSEELNSVNSYLSFISPKVNKDTSGYFVEAIGCTNAVADKQATKDVLTAVSAFFNSDERLKEFKKAAKEEIANKLYEKSQSEDPECSIDTVDAWVTALIPEELQAEYANTFTELANNEPYSVPSVFKSNATEAKKGIDLKIASKEIGWSMNMERSLLGVNTGSIIQYDKGNKKLIIKELPDNIMKNLDAALDIPSE